MSELKACPFCGHELTYFGKDRWYGEISDCYKHPQSETIKCPISSLIFPKDLWNTRPLESSLQSALTAAQEENKRLVFALENKNNSKLDGELSMLKGIEKELSNFNVDILTKYQEENKRYKDALIELRDVIGLDDDEYKIVESALNGGKNG